MKQYLGLLRDVLHNGRMKGDRTGTGTRSVFGRQVRYDLQESFPLLTTKRIHLPSVKHELFWFLRGDTNTRYLNDNGVKIWDAWSDENGDLGPVYGEMWRRWPTTTIFDGNEIEGTQYIRNGCIEHIDQISNVMDQIKTDPESRRLIVTGWNPSLLPDPSISPQENVAMGKQALPPCHTMFQFYCEKLSEYEQISHFCEDKDENPYTLTDADIKYIQTVGPQYKLSCQLYQRSADVFLGVPFNVASYALLTHMVAAQSNMLVGEFIHSFGDLHLYNNHVEQAREQLKRDILQPPQIELNKDVDSIFDYTYDDIQITGYHSHPAIKAPIAV